jgi:hypothetical protein
MANTVDWALLDHAAKEPVKVGDMVSADAGGLPIYRVMAFEAGRAWVAAAEGAPARAMPFDIVRKDGAAPEDDSRRWVYTASRIVMSAHGVPALLDQMARLQAAIAPRPAADPDAAEPVLQWKGREAGVRN